MYAVPIHGPAKAVTLAVDLPIVLLFLQSLSMATFQQKNAQPHMALNVRIFFFFFLSDRIAALASFSLYIGFESVWSMISVRLAQDTLPSAKRD